MPDSRLRKALIRLAQEKPELRPHLFPLLRESSRKYIWRDLRRGDYSEPGITSSKLLVKSMADNAKRIQTSDERSHFVEQVQYAESTHAITSQQAQKLMAIAEGRFRKAGVGRSGGLPPKVLKEMLNGIRDIIVMNAKDSRVTDQVFKMVLRFARNLEYRGIHIRSPQALAEDLLHLATVPVKWEDMHKVQEVLSWYVSGSDTSDISH